jgi:carbon-monoxide dehydrogenase medium subunit
VKPAPFEYHRAESVDEALDAISRLGDEAKFLAGGQSLVPMMNFRLARPSALVDISRLDALAYVRADGPGLRIGALTRHRAIEIAGDGLPETWRWLSRAATWVGHYPIRTAGTFGGSIAHADPSAEWPLVATLLDAQMVARSTRGERVIPAGDFFLGFLTTALEPDEMLVEVRFPATPAHAALAEFARRKGDFAIVAAAVALDVTDGACRSARVALGGVDVVPVRAPAAERVLAGTAPTSEAFREAGEAAAKEIDPPGDIHGSSEYRRRLAAVMIERALAQALAGE